MNYYFIANIRIKNKLEYQKYLDNAEPIFKKYKGEYLSVDDNPTVLEGTWDYTRNVLIKFKTKNDFYKWYNSEDYKKILKFRLGSSDCDTILVQGL